ncbi:MAG: rod shape-determining protein MreD [Chloroflexota bacterium]|nr:rod shape-determining protein MreD [Chloroflexota bacterium]
MTLPFAALGAIVAALIETTVLPEIPLFGAYPDLLLALAVVAAVIMGFEDGLVWAFLGGLLVDLLTPGRPIGAVTLTLLLVVGIAAALSRAVGQRRLAAVVITFGLTWVFHALLLGVLVLTEGIALAAFDARVIFLVALLNMILAVPVAAIMAVIERRFDNGDRERAAW